ALAGPWPLPERSFRGSAFGFAQRRLREIPHRNGQGHRSRLQDFQKLGVSEYDLRARAPIDVTPNTDDRAGEQGEVDALLLEKPNSAAAHNGSEALAPIGREIDVDAGACLLSADDTALDQRVAAPRLAGALRWEREVGFIRPQTLGGTARFGLEGEQGAGARA